MPRAVSCLYPFNTASRQNALLTSRVHIAKVTLSHERQRRDAGVRVYGEPRVPHSGIKTG
nr:hypothetical protein [Nostoc flagelliforme]